MDVKIDTKEKFSVIEPNIKSITANMSDELTKIIQPYLEKEVPHLILNLKNVDQLDSEILTLISEIQAQFYNENFSFVICELNKTIIEKLEELDLLDTMNITPTESEAWDILQMEEMEREMLNDL